jgi:EAL domain-containing protein (putative c-di-GMP-specific phosphodiesterase class I)/GGDEF domain-containing protein/CBS domain-containing protein
MNPMEEALDYIIKNKQIKTVFQPIISLRDGSLLGHEALSRITCDSIITNIDMLFTVAGDNNRIWDLEQLCRTKALEASCSFMISPSSQKLFLNVNPHTMHDEKFMKGFTKSFLMKYDIAPHNVIFEITERDVITDMNTFKTIIEHYKCQDYRIAVDDCGSGYSGLNLISDVDPNYIKLDMKLIRDVDRNSIKYAIIKGMVEFSKVSNVQLIAEGIETNEELETLICLGVQYGQGYYIQRPESDVREIDLGVLKALKLANMKRNHFSQSLINNLDIKNLCTTIEIVPPNEPATTVYEKITQTLNCLGVCVVENEIPVGIVTCDKLALQMSGNYGYYLNYYSPISKLMDTTFLSVDEFTPLSMVSSMAMGRPNRNLYDFIVVTSNDKLTGVVTVKELLQKTTEMEVSAAKHQNPLTGLPGNLVIERKLNQCITSLTDFCIAYLDIDNFKAYNDVYGFENGDLVIKLLADILKRYISEEQFVGHIGGDDFVVILNFCVQNDFFIQLSEQFENEVLALYDDKDVQNGYIICPNRRGEIEQFPLITLTCVQINSDKKTYTNVLEMTEILAAMKKCAKQKVQSKKCKVKSAK